MAEEMLVCDSCGEEGVPMPDDFMEYGCIPPPCTLCQAEQEPLDLDPGEVL